MPRKPKTPCRHPGCPELVEAGKKYCAKHKPLHPEEIRSKATDVDHVIPFRGDMSLFWDESNWQALCHRHHSMKTRREDQTPEYRF